MLDGKNVVMKNKTDFNQCPDFPCEISGSNRSVIDIIDQDGKVVLRLQAKGVLYGSYFGGVDIDMDWVSKKSVVKASGKVSGKFYWDPDYSEPYSPNSPHGTFTLTGTYK